MKKKNPGSSATPVATNVTIMGEPMPGGTVRGSYLYSGTGDEAVEGRSVARWYVDEIAGPITENFDADIYQSMVGQTIRFAITPVSETGVAGVEVYSEPLTVTRGFQNISEEEIENSFLKQTGNFSLYRGEPSDRILTSTSGAFAIKSGATQSVVVKGRADQGGTPPAEIAQYLKNNPAARMAASAWDFGAVVQVSGTTNRILLWGPHIPATIPPNTDLNNIKFVYSNESSLAWIHNNPPPGKNTIGAIGPVANGGAVPDDIQRALLFDKPKAIYATSAAFAVLTEDGRVYAWGHAASGGLISEAAKIVLNQMKVTQIYATAGAFCAVGPERIGDPNILTLAVFGGPASGGALVPGDLEKIMDDDGVKHVVANRDSFVVITKRRSKAFSWGGAYGGTMNQAALELAARGNIRMCVGSAYAFVMINQAGASAAWGATGFGGNKPTSMKGRRAVQDEADAGVMFKASGAQEQIRTAFQQLKVEEFYAEHTGAEGVHCACYNTGKARSSLSRLFTTAGNILLVSNDMSFLMIVQDAGGYTQDLINWGHATYGGAMSSATRQVLMASKINDVFCTNGAYATISAQGGVPGAVVAFGGTSALQEAGEIPAVLQPQVRTDVSQIYSIKRLPPYNPTAAGFRAAFSARRQDGMHVNWGSVQIAPAEVYDPANP